MTFAGSEGTGGRAVHTFNLEVYTMSGGRRRTIMKTMYKGSSGQSIFLGLGQLSSGETLILAIKAS